MKAPAPSHAPPSAVSPAFALTAIVLLAATLRTPLTSVGPLLGEIRASTGLAAAVAGMLNTLPLLAFGLVSLAAPALGRKLGLERSLFAAMLVLAAAVALRSTPGVAPLFIGTLAAGIAITIGNVMLPAVIKREFPTRVSQVTGVYAITMTSSGGIAAGVAVPLADLLGGWRASLLCALALIVPAAIVWAVWMRREGGRPAAAAPTAARGGVWRSWLAWQVTLFNGAQALSFYTLVAWLPSMLSEMTGSSAAMGGWMLGLVQMTALGASIVLSAVLGRFRDQRLPGVAVSLVCVAGFAGMALAPAWAVFWLCVTGAGLGGTLMLSLALVSLRTSSHHQAAAMAGMSQSVGYLIGAAGPLLAGILRDHSPSWGSTLWLLVAMSAFQAWVGYGAGRKLHIGA